MLPHTASERYGNRPIATMEELFYNKYLKEEKLGRGASSEVWRVTDQQTGVIQAIKIYNPAVAIENDGIEMLKHEFALMANINHQNLLRPLFFGIDGIRPFLVLPFCKNGNLKKWVGKFTEDDAWRLLHDVASGLAYLHKQQPPIIHQDIKPENILIGDDGSYLLTDFGISAHASNTTRATISSTLTSAGTVAYMPPEKFGKEKTLITLSDIWSLGAMTYEMLTGEVPFSIGVMEGGALQMNGAEIPYLPEGPNPELAEVIYKCLSKNPWARPKAADLELIAGQKLHGQKVTVITPSPPTPSKLKRLWVIIAAVVTALVGVVGAVVIRNPDIFDKHQEEKPVITEKPVEEQYEQAYKMILDGKQAKDGFELLKKLSTEQHYERATFLWSRLLFNSKNEEDNDDDWEEMRKNAKLNEDNQQAHELLELAVIQDTGKTNPDSRYELASDYFHADRRDDGYKNLRTKENMLRAIDILDEAIDILENRNESKTTIRPYKELREDIDRKKDRI